MIDEVAASRRKKNIKKYKKIGKNKKKNKFVFLYFYLFLPIFSSATCRNKKRISKHL
jgi:hypothetical protein